MSNYYDYREVKVMIAHRLMALDGWKVYDYSPDQSDSMTDYYCPATWGGIAEKNGYVLCVDVYGAREPREIRKYNYTGFSYDTSIADKIKKLEAMTVERGASEQEAASAKVMIERLQKKAEENAENQSKYIVTGMIPGHQAHPNKCNWHIEKDGIIIAKGNGILKYSEIYYKEDYKKQTEKEIREEITRRNSGAGWFNDEELEKSVKYQLEEQEKVLKLKNDFDKFINKIDTTCGGLLGEGDGFIYEKVTVTEYKKENKVFETENGSIKEGQCFILKTGFNYGRSKGLVYRIHRTEYNGKEHFHAYKLNGKLTKECTGRANQANYWSYITDDTFLKWIVKGSISWCDIKEVKTAYEVEKVVKKTINSKVAKTEKKQSDTKETESQENIDINNLTFEVSEDIDTRDNSKIYIVKINESLSREEYIKVNSYIKSIGGYYSKFKHGFIFKEDPKELLNVALSTVTKETEANTKTEATEEVKPTIEYEITEDKSPFKQSEIIYLVKVKNELSKNDFAEVKQKLAKLNGFYSSLKDSFIFKYDPSEKLITN
ncbi:hypothetical protein DS742_14185 [Lacrimispora amygdalina]|uniref:Uncharacterized protein n=1 Tax=Lacrimispora amygdalina TaxID=253257 RepID=A0A3E2NB65_9FIRM|nr:hypothetical protein [Clostridium indicum]RFZ78258.1 hypothetical protein DS742_14185 [Clostridium indicum]